MNNSQEYIFALVRFMENAKQYAYLSNDSRIKKDDVVLVSTPKGDNLGIVEDVIRCDEKPAPYPPEKAKAISRIVGHKLRVNWKPEKPSLFVSNSTDQAGKPACWIQRKHLFTSDEYECSYCKYCFDRSFPICPNCHKHMTGKPMNQTSKRAEKTAAWIEEEHLFGEKTYKCSNCSTRSGQALLNCPKCKAQMTKTKYDPVWVDEMAFYDGDY